MAADPGIDLVLNVHLRPSGKDETLSPTIGLYFSGQPQKKFPMLMQLEHDGVSISRRGIPISGDG